MRRASLTAAAATNHSFSSASQRFAARRSLGEQAEDRAAAFLESQEFRILLRNFRRRGGELDIVAAKFDLLVVAEVRARSRDDYGTAAASVDHAKQRKIVRTTTLLLQHYPSLRRYRVRFDVLSIRDGQVEWLRAAFDA